MAGSQTQSDSDKSPGGTGDADALLHLYKMSTTAGLGSQDYVEINKFSIACLVAGATSAFSLLASFLLAIPIVGVFFGFMAFRQIRNSAGTQTGRGVAIVGLILCLGFSLGLGGKMVMEAAEARQAAVAMDELTSKLSDSIVHRKLDVAYGLFSDDFQARVTPDFFAQRIGIIMAPSPLGDFKAVHANPECKVDTTPRGQTGIKQLVFVFSNGEVPAGAMFIQLDGKWMLDDIPGVFGKPEQEQK